MAKKSQPQTPIHALEYLYRDAANWKTHGLVLLEGLLTAGMRTGITESLDSGLYFVAEQVGIPALQRRHNADYGSADEDLDHAFHELIDVRIATAEDLAQAEKTFPAEDLVNRFASAKGRWDCALSPYA